MVLKKKKTTKWADFKFWLYLGRLHWELKILEFKRSIRILVYCQRGKHTMIADTWKLTISGARRKRSWSKRSKFSKCNLCQEMLFDTEQDMRAWLWLKKHENKLMTKFVKSIAKDLNKKRAKPALPHIR